MSAGATENDVRSLLRRAEQAIRSSKPRDHILRLLEQIVSNAAADSEAARFAHRHLAELRLEDSPWRAALHLRRVIQLDAEDDIAHALMGLCQALQANFKSAVASYRRAVALAPGNPWYSHNLGHLLDVALGAPRDALPYLRRAHKIEPAQEEVSASLAHCLGRLGVRDEALAIARGLVTRNPRDAHLCSLLTWLESGAPAVGDRTVPGLLSAMPPPSAGTPRDPFGGAVPASGAPLVATLEGDVGRGDVEELLFAALSRGGRPSPDLDRARALWNDYARIARPVLGRPAVLAAAVEYALARIEGSRVKQKDVAASYGVSVSSLQTRYASIRAVLRLQPGDSRYARARKRDSEPLPPG